MTTFEVWRRAILDGTVETFMRDGDGKDREDR